MSYGDEVVPGARPPVKDKDVVSAKKISNADHLDLGGADLERLDLDSVLLHIANTHRS
jgi:hypothetical protein